MTPADATTRLSRNGTAARSVDLYKVYGSGDAEVVALGGVTVDFEAGRFTAIMGPSGSGKSTLLHCIAGLDAPTAGQVFIGEVDLTTLSEKQLTLLRREKVGFVFQAYNLVPTLTAAENITLPLDIAGDKPDRGWFDTVVDAVGLRSRFPDLRALAFRTTLDAGIRDRHFAIEALVEHGVRVHGQLRATSVANVVLNRDGITATFAEQIRLALEDSTGFVNIGDDSGVLQFVRDRACETSNRLPVAHHKPPTRLAGTARGPTFSSDVPCASICGVVV